MRFFLPNASDRDGKRLFFRKKNGYILLKIGCVRKKVYLAQLFVVKVDVSIVSKKNTLEIFS